MSTRKIAKIIEMLEVGKTYNDISEAVNLTPRTVESVIERLKIKFNTNSNKELVQFVKRIKITG
jgi:DNA-binding NarL/FixJ family response regulator